MSLLRRSVPRWFLVASAATLLCLLHATSVITTEVPLRDAAQNVAIGAQLADGGTFGLRPSEPFTMYREPLYPAAVALQTLIDPRLRDLVPGRALEPIAVIALKQQNLLWAAILLLSVAGLVARLTRSARWLAGMLAPAAAVVLVHVTMVASRDVMDRTLTELPAAAMLTLAALLGVDVVDAVLSGARRRSIAVRGIGLGAALAALALTKASFLYIVPVHLLLLWGYLSVAHGIRTGRDPAPGRRRIRAAGAGILAALLAFTLVAAPWVVRNEVRFDEASIAGRSGIVLWYRAVKNTMTSAEQRAAWVVYSPGPLRGPVATALGVDLEDRSATSALRRVDRFGFYFPQEPVDRSFYRRARNDRARLTERFTAGGVETWTEANLLADAVLRERALEALASDPWATLRTAPLFLWRGTWPMLSSEVLPRALLGPFNPLAMAAVVVGAVVGLLRRRVRLLATALLPFGAVVFFGLFTHFEGRFALPVVPVGLAVAVAAAVRGASRWSRRDGRI